MNYDSQALVSNWIASDETRHFEVKRVSKGIELSRCLQSISAFANTEGGLLVLGLEDFKRAQGADRLYGIEENESVVDELRKQLPARITPPIGGELGPAPEFHRIPCTLRDGRPGHLMAIEVRPSRDLHSIAEGGTWVRLDKGNRQLSAKEITERRYRLGAASVLDQPVDVEADLLDTVWWQDYRNQRGLTRPQAEALRSIGLAKKVDVDWRINRLAVLLFAEFPSELLGEKCAIRLFHYQGEAINHSHGSTTNLLRKPRTIGGPAIRQIQDALKAVEDELASGVQVSPMGFEVIQRYPRRAVQEAITNAVIHRDYSIPADIQIRLFSDRIEVESPGGLPHRLRPQDLGKVRSHPRNISLVNHLREFPVPPNQDAGEGVLMMQNLMHRADLYPPLYRVLSSAGRESVEVTLLNGARPSVWDQVSDYLDKHGEVGNADVRKILGTDNTLGVSRQLKSWVDDRLLEVVNPDSAKQTRRYRKPTTSDGGDLFAWLLGNEPAHGSQQK